MFADAARFRPDRPDRPEPHVVAAGRPLELANADNLAEAWSCVEALLRHHPNSATLAAAAVVSYCRAEAAGERQRFVRQHIGFADRACQEFQGSPEPFRRHRDLADLVYIAAFSAAWQATWLGDDAAANRLADHAAALDPNNWRSYGFSPGQRAGTPDPHPTVPAVIADRLRNNGRRALTPPDLVGAG